MLSIINMPIQIAFLVRKKSQIWNKVYKLPHLAFVKPTKLKTGGNASSKSDANIAPDELLIRWDRTRVVNAIPSMARNRAKAISPTTINKGISGEEVYSIILYIGAVHECNP